MSKDLMIFNICDHNIDNVQYEENDCPLCHGTGVYYDFALDEKGKMVTCNNEIKLQQEIVRILSTKKKSNKFDLDYISNEELYFGFKTANRFFIGLNTNNSSATSTNQQFNRYFSKVNSSYIPSVGVEITNMNNNTNPGMAFDCLLTVIPS